jgi:hypothetical protein
LLLLTALCTSVALGAGTPGRDKVQAEKVLGFKTSKTFDLDMTVGEVKIASVELSDVGRGHSGGLASRLRGGSDSELTTTLRAHFMAENKTHENWEITFMIEFLDKAGKVIDRDTKKSKWDHEAHAFDFDHQILEYVVPMIDKVRIKFEGEQL